MGLLLLAAGCSRPPADAAGTGGQAAGAAAFARQAQALGDRPEGLPAREGMVPISFALSRPGRVSLAVYSADGAVQLRSLLVGERLAAGWHTAWWDGLDRDGQALPPGGYPWRLVSGPGIEAEFLDALGANPKAGPWARWIGNHSGPATIAVGQAGIVVGAPIAEGPPNIHFFEPDFATTRWLAPHYGWSGYGHRVLALTKRAVVSLSQDAKVSLLDLDNGSRLKQFDVLWEGDQRPGHDGGRELHLAARGDRFAISYSQHDALRWFDLDSGARVREIAMAKPRRVALLDGGEALVLGEAGVVRVAADGGQTVVVPAAALVTPAVLAWDAAKRTLLVANGHPDNRILRFAEDGRLLARYGIEGGRRPGPYRPDAFVEVADIAAADNGCFYVVEGGDVGGGLRRIALVGEDGRVVDERFGGAEFFSCAAAVPGNPREVYYSSCPDLIGRYELDPETGRSRLTHLLRNRNWGFPGFAAFPHYRPVIRRGQVYLVLEGRFILRPDLESGELLPVALADFRPWHGWKTVPEPIALAAAHHGIDPQSPQANAFTWSDANGNGRLDPEEFRFHDTGPRRGYACLDDDFNVLFGYYFAWNHTWDEVNKRWIGFDFEGSLYATLPNLAPDSTAPIWDWARLERSAAKVPRDPLGLWQRLAPRAVQRAADGRIDILFGSGGGAHADTHPHRWPTAQTTGTRLISALGDRVVQVVGKHASEGPPRDTQFGEPSHLLGTVAGNLIVCDRDAFTTAWTADGLFIGMLLEQPRYGERPKMHVPLEGGDDWMSAGSIAELGNGEALWFAPTGDRAMVFRLRGFADLERQNGIVSLQEEPAAAPLAGEGLRAEYFASPDLAGEPLVARIDPRLWFYDHSQGGQIVAAWAKDGPCEGIAAGQPFSARWSGSFVAPFGEPFWLRVYNTRPGHGHTPSQQAWADGKGFVRLWLNDQLLIDKWHDSPATNPWQTPPLPLQAGQRYDLKVEYAYAGGDDAQFSLVWCSYTLEWMRLPTAYLHPEAAPSRPVLSATAVEATAHEEGERPGRLRFALRTPHDRDVPVAYRLDGTAAAADYRLEGEPVVIRAGETAAELIVRPLDDALVEANETVAVTLLPSHHYAGDGTAGEAVVTIVDNDNLLVDDTLAIYYTFDNLGPLGASDFAAIRNEAGPDYALRVQAYMRSRPQLAPGLPNHGEALAFPEGREDVRAAGRLEAGDFTIAFWFRSPQADSGLCIAGGVNFFLRDGRLHADYGGWPVAQPEGGDLGDNRWHHAALVWNRDRRRQLLFVDGRQVAEATGAEGAGFGTAIQLGRDNRGGPLVGGSLDEFRVYRRRLEADELRALGADNRLESSGRTGDPPPETSAGPALREGELPR